jgi:putative phosphoesterase
MRVGLISDTHGLLRPQALDALRGSDLIVHAGDVGGPAIVEALRTIAPVTVVRGNNDRGEWAGDWPETTLLTAGLVRIHVLHDVKALSVDPVTARVDVIVSGHSHKPAAELRDGVWYVNPGSAGPRRFRLPIAVARLHIVGKRVEPHILTLAA